MLIILRGLAGAIVRVVREFVELVIYLKSGGHTTDFHMLVWFGIKLPIPILILEPWQISMKDGRYPGIHFICVTKILSPSFSSLSYLPFDGSKRFWYVK